MKTKSFKRHLKWIIPILLAVLAIAAFYNGLTVRHYDFATEKLGAGEALRVIVVADLHSHIYGENQTKIITKIRAEQPDLILLAGDIADDYVPIIGTEIFLAEARDIAPLFYATGNHEYWSGEIASIKETIRSYGVIVLEEDYVEIEINDIPLIIAGVDDPEWRRYENKSGQPSAEERFVEFEGDERLKILLAHRPERFEEYMGYSVDLVVSGHAHGGQARIPFILNGLVAPDQGWFPQYAGGLYRHGEMTHIVSRGVSFNPRLPRVFNPPEIVVIDISGAV